MKTLKRMIKREYIELRSTGRFIERVERIERALVYLNNRGA